MWEDMGKRFPGLFHRNWQIKGSESLPQNVSQQEWCRSNERMLESIDKMVGQQGFAEKNFERVRDNKKAEQKGIPKEHVDEHAYSNVEFKNEDGSAWFKFEECFNGTKAAAEGIVDSVHFLAQKCASSARPRVYSLMNVLEEGVHRYQYQQQHQQQGDQKHQHYSSKGYQQQPQQQQQTSTQYGSQYGSSSQQQATVR